MQRFQDYIADLLKPKKRLSTVQGHSHVYLTYEVANETARLVASFGSASRPHEGIVYWAGIPTSSVWVITTVLAPEAETTPGSYRTSVSSNAYVVKTVNELNLQILAQVHGHPTDWVGHSDGDNRGAFMPYSGFYSVILPWYGQRGMLPIEKCGIHQFIDGQFVYFKDEEVRQRFTLVPGSVDLRGIKKAHG
jgi:hypothetical protein